MADVVGGHRHDRQLRQRAAHALDAAGALEERREVRVHVAGEALAARDLALRRRHLAQRLRVVRHVGEDHEHVLAAMEREVLGRGQREARRQQPLRRRIAREVQEQRGALERAALLEAAPEIFGAVVRHADAGEHDREVAALRAAQPRVRGDVDGKPVVRQAAAGEQRQLLPAHEAVHEVERGDAGLDEVARHRARHRIDRQAVDAQALARGDRRPAVDHLADAVEHAAQHRRRDAERQRLAEEAHDRCPDSVRPAVDSSTSIVTMSLSIAATRPRRARPSAPCTSTASCSPTSSVRRRNRSGPSSRVATPSAASAHRAPPVWRSAPRTRGRSPRKAWRTARGRCRRCPRPAAAAAARISSARCRPDVTPRATRLLGQVEEVVERAASSPPAAPARRRGRCPSTRTGAGRRR